ncbi:hypothetical protein BV898_08150 [Hypsibius exemplaris]|uniref:TLDc domain-containing protein n=1 Tax=Hypsibius exemplaris TaxID=2072580 RepID=A0A1W0WR87_HYPEX|nr:hypothetical protein BV898_08150 [Hypsibius exemplaris]
MDPDIFHYPRQTIKGTALVAQDPHNPYPFDQPNKYIQLVRVKLGSPNMKRHPSIPEEPSGEDEESVAAAAKNNEMSPWSFGVKGTERKEVEKRTPRLLMRHSSSIYNAFQRVGKILTDDQFESIWLFLPARYQIGRFSQLVFTTIDDGVSIRTLLDRVKGYAASLLVVKTSDGDVFGAFCSEDWAKRYEMKSELSFFGTGESFLFTCLPRSRVYPWVGWTSKVGDIPSTYQCLFMAANSSTIVIGGGGGGCGLRFNSDLSRGRSETCSTFENQPLCVAGDFLTSTLEVYGLMP